MVCPRCGDSDRDHVSLVCAAAGVQGNLSLAMTDYGRTPASLMMECNLYRIGSQLAGIADALKTLASCTKETSIIGPDRALAVEGP